MFIFVAIKRYRADDESCEGTNTKDPDVYFEWITSQSKDRKEEDVGFPPELERMVAQEDREMKQHQEETEIVNFGVGEKGKR